jgi:hypothetical protein
MQKRGPSTKSWMGWAAFVIATVGGGLGYLFFMDPMRGPESAFLAWAVSGVLLGILLITATADLWFHR